MDFKRMFQNKIIFVVLFLFVLGIVLLVKSFLKPNSSDIGSVGPVATSPVLTVQGTLVKPTSQTLPIFKIDQNPNQAPVQRVASQPAVVGDFQDDVVIQEQLDRDRRQQKETKELKNKLEQTNLELEQEKALSEINKLKKENMGSFSDPTVDGQSNLPQISVDFIGGDSVKKEAILSIGGVSYQVKEKSNPTDYIQVLSISDSSVTLHFAAPLNLTKTIDYKPE